MESYKILSGFDNIDLKVFLKFCVWVLAKILLLFSCALRASSQETGSSGNEVKLLLFLIDLCLINLQIKKLDTHQL